MRLELKDLAHVAELPVAHVRKLVRARALTVDDNNTVDARQALRFLVRFKVANRLEGRNGVHPGTLSRYVSGRDFAVARRRLLRTVDLLDRLEPPSEEEGTSGA